jgi:bacteriorhodopsin
MGLLWLGAAGFGLGAALVAWLARGAEGRARTLGVVATFVPLSMGTWYLLLATGFALRAGDRLVYWGRYADGVTNVPLIVLLLALLAGADRTTTATGMAVGGYSMAATLLATVTTGTAKLVWLGVATASFLALLWLLLGPFGRAAAALTLPTTDLFARTRLLVVGLFACYPVLWALGEPGFALAPGEWLVPARLLLDGALKIGVPPSVVASGTRQSSSASDAKSASN